MNARALLAGALAAAVVRWPVSEGLWALTWSAVFDAVGPADAATRRLLDSQADLLDAALPRGAARMLQAGCLSEMERRSMLLPIISEDYGQVATGLRMLQSQKDADGTEAVAEAALRPLPPFALGALDGCVTGSPLSPLCQACVARRVRAALAQSTPRLTRLRAWNSAEANRLACRVLASAAQPVNHVPAAAIPPHTPVTRNASSPATTDP